MPVRRRGKPLQFCIGERGGNQQNRIRTVRARLDNLVLVDHEVLAQARQRHSGRSQFKVAQAALEVRLIGQHRKRRSTACLITLGQPATSKSARISPFDGEAFLISAMIAGPDSSPSAQSRRPSARLMQAAPPLEFGQRHPRLGRGHRGSRRSKNLCPVESTCAGLSIRGTL